MDRANPIAHCLATLADGGFIAYVDREPGHIRQHRFAAIMAAEPVAFTVVATDGSRFSVDLVSGALEVAGERFETVPQLTPLRLIYYKRMAASTSAHGDDGASACRFFAVGWQTTTVDGRNLRAGIKVFPAESRYEVTEDI